jgi:hypothetical protein
MCRRECAAQCYHSGPALARRRGRDIRLYQRQLCVRLQLAQTVGAPRDSRGTRTGVNPTLTGVCARARACGCLSDGLGAISPQQVHRVARATAQDDGGFLEDDLGARSLLHCHDHRAPGRWPEEV